MQWMSTDGVLKGKRQEVALPHLALLIPETESPGLVEGGLVCPKITYAGAPSCEQRYLAAGERGVEVARTVAGVLALKQAVMFASLSTLSVSASLNTVRESLWNSNLLCRPPLRSNWRLR